MSTYFTTTEAKIINSEHKNPTKFFNKETGAPCFQFDICIKFSKKINNEWQNKFIYFNCIIWNENKIEKFISKFDNNAKNYITIINAKLTDNFNIDTIEKTTKDNKIYNQTVYSNFSLFVEDFVITYKPINENENSVPNESDIDDEVPI